MNNVMHNKLEKRALGFAAAQVLIFSDEKLSYYDNYLLFMKAVEDNKRPNNCEIWQPFEDLDYKDVLKLIHEFSECFLCQYKAVLNEAKNSGDLTAPCMEGAPESQCVLHGTSACERSH
jgi:hypothetical protein